MIALGTLNFFFLLTLSITYGGPCVKYHALLFG